MAGASAISTVGASIQFGSFAAGIFTANANASIICSPSADTITITAAGLTVTGPITGSLSGNVTGDVTGNLSGVANSANQVRSINFHADAIDPTGVANRLNCDATFYAAKLFNAVWNDIADFIEVESDTPVEYGKAYVYYEGRHRLSEEYAEKGVLGIASDTLGFGVGQKPADTPQLPIAVAGFVLAHVDQIYESGTPLTCTKNGYLTEMGLTVVMEHPERLIATFYKLESSKIWNGINVNGRHWVKVR